MSNFMTSSCHWSLPQFQDCSVAGKLLSFCFFLVSYLLLQCTASNLVDGLMFAAETVSYTYGSVDALSKGKTPCLSKNIGVVFYNSAYATLTSVGVQPITVHLCYKVLEGERTSFLLSITKPSHVPYWPGPGGAKSTLSVIEEDKKYADFSEIKVSRNCMLIG